tara:strand:- start:319 stop:459 length:141 start_codon:yes stop_codon:yes gene_type:complete
MSSYWVLEEYGGVIATITLFFLFMMIACWIKEDIFSDDEKNFKEKW